jgi:polyhydroxybutyrate depolymerase
MNVLRVGAMFSCLVWVCFACKIGEEVPGENKFRFEEQISVGNQKRSFTINLPPDFYEKKNVPVVIGLHGGGGNGEQFETSYDFTPISEQRGYAVVYPDGSGRFSVDLLKTWNAGTCCEYAVEENIDDVAFFKDLIDYLIKNYKIDANRVFVTGMSNGAMMSYRLACELSEKIRAIAAVSGPQSLKTACKATRPVPVLHIHSVKDLNVPHLGGLGINKNAFPPVLEGLNYWVTRNGCKPTAKVVQDDEKFKLSTWTGCQNEASIYYFLTKDGGHAWAGARWVRKDADEPSKNVNANKEIFDFFDKF